MLLGQFELVSIAGRGATGTVYRAWQHSMERWVAVKVLHRDLLGQPDMVARMEREARAVARLSHPAIVSAFASGTTPDGEPFLVMEFVDGQSLESALDGGGKMAPPRAIAIARQIAGALAEAHAAGVIHRDLKPANVMLVQRRCAADAVKLLDFGIAKLERDETVLTRQGAICGTPYYLAPEQAAGEPIDHRADLYSVGVLLYRMVTGRVPFGGSVLAAMLAHLHERPLPPAEVDGQVSPALSDLILRCMEKDPALRPQSAEQLDALLAAVDAPVAQDPVPARGSRAGWGAALIATAAVGAILALVGVRYFPAQSLGSGQSPAAIAPLDLPAVTPPADPGEPPRRALVVAEGGYAMRVLLPERILAGVDYEVLLDVWDPEGEPLATAEMILTVDDPDGVSRGIAARPTAERGRYRFTRRFDRAGSHQLRVFPPAGGTTIRLFFDVIDPHSV